MQSLQKGWIPFFLLPGKALQSLFSRIGYNLPAQEISLLPTEVKALGAKHLKVLEMKGLIKKDLKTQSVWCDKCFAYNHDTSIERNYNVNKRSFSCFNCGTFQSLKKAIYTRYFASDRLIASFIRQKFDLSLQKKNIIEENLIYLGIKDKPAYYLALRLSVPNINSALKRIQGNNTCYVLSLEEYNYFNNLKIPPKVKIYELAKCFSFIEGELRFLVPSPPGRAEIARLGGLTCSEKKFGKARRFVEASFKEKRALDSGQKKKQICTEIFKELIKRTDLIANLSEDNLFDWIIKQTGHLK